MTSSTRARSWIPTRIETWAVPGIPDLDICDDRGLFHKVELKVANGNKVELRPHQVAFLTRHQHASVWILVRKGLTARDSEVFLYHGRQAVDLSMDGLSTRPISHVTADGDWEIVWSTISPLEG